MMNETLALSDRHELLLIIIGALICVAMMVFATYFLFKGQSKQQLALMEQQQQHQLALIEEQQQQDRERDIFRERLNSYNSFLEALRQYVTQPNETSKKGIIFHAMAIRMHCTNWAAKSLDENIISIIKDTGEKGEIKSLVAALNRIAYIFREELYGESAPSNSGSLDDFVKAFSKSAEEQTEDHKTK